jgi:hypothetical protein
LPDASTPTFSADKSDSEVAQQPKLMEEEEPRREYFSYKSKKYKLKSGLRCWKMFQTIFVSFLTYLNQLHDLHPINTTVTNIFNLKKIQNLTLPSLTFTLAIQT